MRFQVIRHKRWLDVYLPRGYFCVVWRKGWRKSYAYWSPDATPKHTETRWVWGKLNYYKSRA